VIPGLKNDVAGFWVTKLLLLALMVSGWATTAPLVADFASYPRMEFSRRVGTETHRNWNQPMWWTVSWCCWVESAWRARRHRRVISWARAHALPNKINGLFGRV